MPVIRILPNAEFCPQGDTITAASGTSICEALLENGIAIEHACEMSCACTTCHVVVKEGLASLGEIDVAAEGQTEGPKSPGMLLSHYAPRLPVRLTCDDPRPGEALLAFGPDVPEGFALVENLSPSGNPVEAATNLFAALRRLDQPELTGIAVMPIPSQGLGLALQDRLRRAASPR